MLVGGIASSLRTFLMGWLGIDLVAMSVNDLIVQGAEPLYFLDYFACSKLEVEKAATVVKGIAEGCRISGCALIGGETAEMPGMYHEGELFRSLYCSVKLNSMLTGDYDLAGFAVGAVERSLILPQPSIAPGDVLLGLASSGLHSNGFSLVRKVVGMSGLTYSSPSPWNPTTSLGQELLTPTKIYIKQLLPLIQAGLIKGMSHITGGGFTENIPRVLPKGTGCSVDASAWELPPVFRFLMQHGGIEPLEMARTFNNGVGMVLIVDRAVVDEVKTKLTAAGEQVFQIGEVTAQSGVQMRNMDGWHA